MYSGICYFQTNYTTESYNIHMSGVMKFVMIRNLLVFINYEYGKYVLSRLVI